MSEVSAKLTIIGKDQSSAEIKKVSAALKDLDSQAVKLQKSGALKGALEGIAGRFGLSAASFSTAGVVAGLAYVGIESVKAADKLQIIENRARGVFEGAFPQMEQSARSLGQELRRSNDDMLEMEIGFGSLMKGAGFTGSAMESLSEQMTRVSVSFSNFVGIADEQGFEMIQGGVLGMGRALQRYGIFVNDAALKEFAHKKGIDDKIESMSQAQQMLLRMNLIQDQNNKLMGQSGAKVQTVQSSWKTFKGSVQDAFQEIGKPQLAITNLVLDASSKKLDEEIGKFRALKSAIESTFGALQQFAILSAKALGFESVGIKSYTKPGVSLVNAGGLSDADFKKAIATSNNQKKMLVEEQKKKDKELRILYGSLAGPALENASGKAQDELGKIQDALGDLGRSYKEKARDIDQNLSQLEESHREKMQSIKDEIQGVQDQLADLSRDYDRAVGDIDRSQADLLIRQDEHINDLVEKLDELNAKRLNIERSPTGAVPVTLTEEIEALVAQIAQERKALEAVKGQAGTGVISTYGERSKLSDFERDFKDQEGRRSELKEDTDRRRQALEGELKTLDDKKTLETEVYFNSRQQMLETQLAMSAFEADYTTAMNDINKVTEDTVRNLKIQLEQMKSSISEIDALVRARSDLTGGGSVAERRSKRLENTPDSYLVPNANGGIYDRPTAALIGEAGYPEAVIPMPFGNVPVKIQGDSGSRTQNITFGPFYVSEKVNINDVVSHIKRELQLTSLSAA